MFGRQCPPTNPHLPVNCFRVLASDQVSAHQHPANPVPPTHISCYSRFLAQASHQLAARRHAADAVHACCAVEYPALLLLDVCLLWLWVFGGLLLRCVLVWALIVVPCALFCCCPVCVLVRAVCPVCRVHPPENSNTISLRITLETHIRVYRKNYRFTLRPTFSVAFALFSTQPTKHTRVENQIHFEFSSGARFFSALRGGGGKGLIFDDRKLPSRQREPPKH